VQTTPNETSGRFDPQTASDSGRPPDRGFAGESRPAILIVCADPALGMEYAREIERRGMPCRMRWVRSSFEPGQETDSAGWAVILLDESALPDLSDAALLSAVGLCAQAAQVVVFAQEHFEGVLTQPIASGRVEFVPRVGHFVADGVDRVERMARAWSDLAGLPLEDEDFGEILRHEVNNPLTGILGNAELLLARRDTLSPASIERLKTIAELAVRLRETVRRLSHIWSEKHDHARTI